MKNRAFHFSKVLVGIFLFVSVICPLISIITHINVSDIKEIIYAPQFKPMLANSFGVTLLSTGLSILLAFVLAWCVNRTGIRYKSVFSVLFTLPMLIPSISHGMGLVLLLGDNGLLTNALNINIGLYGYKGIVLGSMLYSFPVAFLMLNDVFQYEDYTTYEAAGVLGLSKLQQFATITVPNMRRTLISTIFAVFTMIFTDYGVPLVVGGKIMTFPVYMYREVIGLLDFSKGAIIGIILLFPAVIAFILDLKNTDGGNSSTITKRFEVTVNKKRDIVAYVLCGLVILLISLPVLAFAYLSVVKQYPNDMTLTLRHMLESANLGVGTYLINSLAIAGLTSLIGLGVIYFTAYLTSRSRKSFSTFTIHLISMLTLAIPGLVLGLSYILWFKGSVIYGTLAVIVLVNMVHFFASPYLMAYNSLRKFNENLEDVALTLGIGKFRLLKDVFVPCTMETMIEMFAYLYVNSMVTISAVSFLANFRNMPLALLIPQFDSQSLIEATAFISIIILVVNVVIKAGTYFVKRHIRRSN